MKTNQTGRITRRTGHFVGFVMLCLGCSYLGCARSEELYAVQIKLNGQAQHDKTNKMTSALSEDLDQPGHPQWMPRLI